MMTKTQTSPRSLIHVTFGASLLVAMALGGRALRAEPPVDFGRDVRPILSDNCFTCHGFDDATRKAGLRLDEREAALKPARSKKPAIVPGNPGKSELIARLVTTDDDERMPPEKTGKHLAPAQIELLKKWIAQGANYKGHWAFEPPVRPAAPAVKDASWARGDVDRFILARLEAAGLTPSKEADRTTLIRRVSLDLTGLPPTPREVEAFINDKSADAYERLVDRLLASPRYGERMAMYWLDGARYADSHGYQADWERFQWRWRDWVIDAFNRNYPFDQFTIDQIAGDLRPDATVENKIGTGFHRNHRMNTEGGTIPEEWRTEYVIDRVDTTGTVWLGLTLGCCRCHDHKYDPISQKEFYQLYSIFNNNDESGRGAEKAGNHEPTLKVPRLQDSQKLVELEQQVAQAQARVGQLEKDLPAQQAQWEKRALNDRPGVAWTNGEPAEMTSAGKARLAKRPDKSILVSGPNPASDTYSITLKTAAGLKAITAIRLEALPENALPGRGPGRSVNGNIVLTDVRVQQGGKDVKLASASADFAQENFPVANAIDADKSSGWAIYPQAGQAHQAVFEFDEPVATQGAATTLVVKLEFKSPHTQHALGHFRLSVTDSATPHDAGGVNPAVLAALKLPAEKRSAAQKGLVTTYYRERFAGELTTADRQLARAKKQRDDLEASLPTVMVLREMAKPREAHVLIRGQYDKPGEKVEAGVPRLFGPLPPGAPMNRLGLAQWMVKGDNPLTARVQVNRLWEMLFGTGIVKTSENLGVQADWPSHPELLDWLATEFVRSGWDVKGMLKTMVTSAAYRQSAALRPELLEKDPENRLIARGPRFRLPAEMIRDQAMFASGLLVEKIGGPSVRPYQPDGIWDEVNVYGNLRNYKHDLGEGLYRRSMYTIWKRTAAPPGMTVFDMPNREVCTVKRSRTNTPLQALALMNDVTYLESSRVLAERMIREGGATAGSRIAHGFELATARKPTEAELKLLSGGLSRRLEKYKSDSDAARKLIAQGERKPDATIDPGELAAYTVTASVILNLDEVITRE